VGSTAYRGVEGGGGKSESAEKKRGLKGFVFKDINRRIDLRPLRQVKGRRKDMKKKIRQWS